MTECTYNSSSRHRFTRGGFSANDEMCLIFLHYYPAKPGTLAHCASRLSFQHVLLALGINVWPLTPGTRHLGLRVRDPWQYQNLTFEDYLQVSTNNSKMILAVSRIFYWLFSGGGSQRYGCESEAPRGQSPPLSQSRLFRLWSAKNICSKFGKIKVNVLSFISVFDSRMALSSLHPEYTTRSTRLRTGVSPEMTTSISTVRTGSISRSSPTGREIQTCQICAIQSPSCTSCSRWRYL